MLAMLASAATIEQSIPSVPSPIPLRCCASPSFPGFESQSQLGQDAWALEHLRGEDGCRARDQGAPRGFYIDIGSADGRYLSNTHVMDVHLGWDGLCFDPFPQNMEHRSCAVVSSRVLYDVDDAVVPFAKAGLFGGVEMDLDAHRDHPQVRNRPDADVSVRTARLDTLLSGAAPDVLAPDVLARVPPVIDFVSVDTEGTELREDHLHIE